MAKNYNSCKRVGGFNNENRPVHARTGVHNITGTYRDLRDPSVCRDRDDDDAKSRDRELYE